MRAYERLLHYVRFWSASDSESSSVPSSFRQFDLAHQLAYDMKQIGIENARVNNYCYVYGSIEASPGYESAVPIGFIAHMDTSPEFNGKDVKPQVIENYDGKDVRLGTSGKVLRVTDFPTLKKLKGSTLITTDGTSLLGADDKAGIAEILAAAEHIIKENIPHGKICIAFTPDEEVGNGIMNFDLEEFGAKYAYTMDSWEDGEIVYENFNAATAVFEIHGVNVHTGRAKGIMVNAQLVAIEMNQMLPQGEIPSLTEGYEGFFHLLHSSGNVEHAQAVYNVRDHSRELFEKRKQMLFSIAEWMNQKYGEGTVELSIEDGYRNMKEMVEPCFHIVENAIEAAERIGLEPKVISTRGGTDGARLSFMGLPCPNLGTGGYAFHGPFEHITAEGMDRVVHMLIELIKIYVEQKN